MLSRLNQVSRHNSCQLLTLKNNLTIVNQPLRLALIQPTQPSLVFQKHSSNSSFPSFQNANNNTSGDKDGQQQKPKLSMNDLIPAVSKVFLYGFLTYSIMHVIWWDLEVENRSKQYNGMFY